MELRFTRHARLRLAELAHLGITRQHVQSLIEQPVFRHPNAVAAEMVDGMVSGFPIRVVYVEKDGYYLVITVHEITEEPR